MILDVDLYLIDLKYFFIHSPALVFKFRLTLSQALIHKENVDLRCT